MSDLQAQLARHRPELLRHCYRMMGSFVDAEDLTQDALLGAWEARDALDGEASLRHRLLSIGTRACLDALAGRPRRELPQAERPPAQRGAPPEELSPARWLTPAPDARLFPDAPRAAERRESVALAFLAALQRLPAGERAVLLLREVAGLSAEEVAAALGREVLSVNAALHHAREVAGAPPAPSPEPPPQALLELVRCWEAGDLHGLTVLFREDVALVTPPSAVWFRGAGDVAAALASPSSQAFWSAGVRIALTRANGLPALGLYSGRDGYRLHAVGVTRFEAGLLAELTVFTGPHFLYGFDLPGTTARFPEPSSS
jgi:RNA polymerase sigma-70 factor (ECF subfamily)